MGLRGPIPVPFERAFPEGAYVISAVEPLYTFVNGKPTEQEKDEHGRLLWTVGVHDADEEVKPNSRSFKLKIASDKEPVAPPKQSGSPFTQVEFTGLTATPYLVEVMKGLWKIAFSYRATGLQAAKPATASAPGNGSGAQNGSNGAGGSAGK